MNKEGLAEDLVCMLDERSLPRNNARIQELIERFFIAGAARIDLIAKVIDLDNDIGGYNFDIANLKETEKEIESISKARDKRNFLINYLLYPVFTTIHACYLQPFLLHISNTKRITLNTCISKLQCTFQAIFNFVKIIITNYGFLSMRLNTVLAYLEFKKLKTEKLTVRLAD